MHGFFRTKTLGPKAAAEPIHPPGSGIWPTVGLFGKVQVLGSLG